MDGTRKSWKRLGSRSPVSRGTGTMEKRIYGLFTSSSQLGSGLWRGNGRLHRNGLNLLNLLIHEGLHLCDMLLFQVRETPLEFHVLTYRFILLGDVGVFVFPVLPFIEGPHPGFHRQAAHF